MITAYLTLDCHLEELRKLSNRALIILQGNSIKIPRRTIKNAVYLTHKGGHFDSKSGK